MAAWRNILAWHHSCVTTLTWHSSSLSYDSSRLFNNANHATAHVLPNKSHARSSDPLQSTLIKSLDNRASVFRNVHFFKFSPICQTVYTSYPSSSAISPNSKSLATVYGVVVLFTSLIVMCNSRVIVWLQARPNPSGHSSTALFSMERSLSYVSYAGRSSWLKLRTRKKCQEW